jgi:hypothetical protein
MPRHVASELPYPGAAQAQHQAIPASLPWRLPCSSSISAPAMPHHHQFELPYAAAACYQHLRLCPGRSAHASAMHQHAWRFLIIAQVSAPGYANFHAVLGAVSGSSPPAPGLCPTMLPRAGPYGSPSISTRATQHHKAALGAALGSQDSTRAMPSPCCPQSALQAAQASAPGYAHHVALSRSLQQQYGLSASGYGPTMLLQSCLSQGQHQAQHRAMYQHLL